MSVNPRLAIFCLFLLIVPFFIRAEGSPKLMTETERNYFIKIIIGLSQEVERLQAILQKRLNQQENCSLPKESLFQQVVEVSYCVRGNNLVGEQGNEVRGIDQELFTLFKLVVGEAGVDKSVRYWRVFNNEVADTDAYVETVDDAGHFMVSVNRFGYRDDPIIKKSYAELFAHEYAHIILLQQPELVERFKKTFWSERDLAEAKRLLPLSTRQALKERKQYFEENKERFVSEYATQSVDEDMAETFLAAIVNGWPSKSDNSLKAKKQRILQGESALFLQREIIHNNLERLGVLN